MKEYAIVMIGEFGDLTPETIDYVEEVFCFANRDFLEEEFERLISHGPIYTDYRLAAVKDVKSRRGGKRRVDSQFIRLERDCRDGNWESVHFYAIEFDGEEEPDEEYYIDFASGRLDEYIDELDEEDKPKGEFKVIKSSKEDPAFTKFKEVFDWRKHYLYNSYIEHYKEFYQTYYDFSEKIMENIDESTDELNDAEIDYECCPSDYHFCDFVDAEGKIITEKLEAVKAEQGRD